MEEKEFNDLESLAKFLHKTDGDEESELPSEPARGASVSDDEEAFEQKQEELPVDEVIPDEKPGDAEDILFELDKKRLSEEREHYEKPVDDDGETAEEPEQTEASSAEPKDTTVSAKSKRKKKKVAAELYRKKLRERNRHTRTFAHIFGGVLLSVFIVSVSVFLAFNIIRAALDFAGISTTEFEVEVEIPEDSTTSEIAQILRDNGIIALPDLFTLYSRVADKDGNYLSGLFTLDSTMSYSKLIKTLQKKSKVTETISVTIKEGMTAREVGELLEENKVCRAEDFEYYYRNKQDDYNFEKRVEQSNLKFNQLEGYLFPDTYEFYVLDELETKPDMDTSSYAQVAAQKIYSNTNSKITKAMYKEMSEKGFTLDELITLASIAQKEASTAEDMKLVASVLINRLNSPDQYPHLQSDVTVIYVEENIKPFISEQNKRLYESVIDAYNTYVAVGLPSGPICNPGIDAINAVLDAPKTNYYYFCAEKETGAVYYASTLAEHEQNLVTCGLA